MFKKQLILYKWAKDPDASNKNILIISSSVRINLQICHRSPEKYFFFTILGP